MSGWWSVEADIALARARLHEAIDRMALNARIENIKRANHARDELGVLVSHHRRSLGQIRRHWGNR